MSNKEYDIVIVGASVVGAVFGCALQQLLGSHSLRIALIDNSDLDQQTQLSAEYDSRTFAINLATEKILTQLGLWDAIQSIRAAAFNDMLVWDEGSTASIEFNGADICYDRLGYIVEQRVLLKPMLERLHQGFQVDLFYPRTITGYSRMGDKIHISLENGDLFRTRLLVGADGSNSRVRRFAGIETAGWSYDQSAIVATVETEKEHHFTAMQRFLRTGPLAFLPLESNLSSIVWSADTAMAEQLMGLDDIAFCEQLEQAFESRLGSIYSVSRRQSFPLSLQHSKQYCRPGIALIGDSAHVIHPLAGQGVNLGVMDAVTLAQGIVDTVKRNFDPGKLSLLRNYERKRKTDNLVMMGVMDGFKKLFGSNLGPVQIARTLGLQLTSRSPFAKNTIMRKALGLSGELPEFIKAPLL